MASSHALRSGGSSSSSDGSDGGSDPGKSSASQKLPAADASIIAAVKRNASVEELAPLFVKLPPPTRESVYVQVQRHLPGSTWKHGTSLIPVTGDVASYLDDLFSWVHVRGDIELARRCLEARYGIAHEATNAFSTLDEIRDLYARLANLDPETAKILIETGRPIRTLGERKGLDQRQDGHPLEQVLHGLEMLRADLGTAADFTQLGAAGVGGPAADGMHVIRIEIRLPSQRDLALDDSSPFNGFLASVATYNTGHPKGQVHIDLLLNPDMKAYGMGFAQINTQRTIGVSGGETGLTGIERFRLKGMYMLERHAHAASVSLDTAPLATLRASLDGLDSTYAHLAPSEWKIYLKSLEQQIIDATVLPQNRATTAAQWDQGYADVGRSFGADSKIVRDAVQSRHPGIVSTIELGNEPQSEWALSNASVFPGTDTGRADMIAQFMETTKAAMAAVGTSTPGPLVLNAPAQWDPATEMALLNDVVAYEANHHAAADLQSRIIASPFHARVDEYVRYWTAKNPGESTVPLSIHMYNSPALDAALIAVLSALAGHYKVRLALYVTEFQVDADAGTNAGNAGQTRGLLAAGVNSELAAQHSNVTIVSMLAWSYTDVKKPGKQYDLENNQGLEPLFG